MNNLKIVSVGNGGLHALNHMIDSDLTAGHLRAVNRRRLNLGGNDGTELPRLLRNVPAKSVR